MVKMINLLEGVERVKVDIQVPKDMADLARGIASQLGLPMNALYTMALALFVAELGWVARDKGKSRLQLIEEADKWWSLVTKNVKNFILAQVAKKK